MSSTLHRKRALMHGGNAALFSVGAVGALVVGYVLVDRYRPFRKDLTQSGIYSLSPKTAEMLKGLDHEVKVTYFVMPQSAAENASAMNQDVEDLLEEYKTISKGKISFTLANPLSDAEKLEELGGDIGAAVFQSGDKKIVVEAKDIAKEDMESGEGGMKFDGEEAFDSALLRLKEGKSETACFLSGHGEPAIDAETDAGYSLAKEFLRRENLESKSITLTSVGNGPTKLEGKLNLDKPAEVPVAGPAVPADCTVLVVAGPQQALNAAEGDAIVKYWENGGGVVLLAEPMTHSGVEALAARYGVEVMDGVAADPQRMMRSPLAVIPAYQHHEIVDALAAEQSPVLFVKAAGLKLSDKLPEGVTGTPLLQTSAAGLELVDIKDGTADPDSKKNIPGPIRLGFALEKAGKDGGKPSRVVVMGDSDFASNGAMQAMAQKGAPGNIDLFKNAVEWTVGQKEKIGVGPKTADHHPVTISDRSALFVLLGTGFFLPATIFSGGIAVWLRRRHR